MHTAPTTTSYKQSAIQAFVGVRLNVC